MLSVLIHWVVTALLLVLIANVMPGFVIQDFGVAMVVALLLGLVNVTIKPVVTLLTLPLNIVTLGLFSLVINALMMALVAWFVPGFAISNFWAAFVGALLLALASALINGSQQSRYMPH